MLSLTAIRAQADLTTYLITPSGSEAIVPNDSASPNYQAELTAFENALLSTGITNGNFQGLTFHTVNSVTGNYINFTETVINRSLLNQADTATLQREATQLFTSTNQSTVNSLNQILSADGVSVAINCYNSAGVQLGNNIGACYGFETATTTLAPKAQHDANALTGATTVNLQLNRATTQISNALQSMRSLRNNPRASNQGGGSGDAYELMGGLGLYVNTGGTFGSIDSTANTSGYNLYTRNFNTGLDYKINERLVTGLLFGYTSSVVDISGGGGNFGADTFRVSPYISLAPTDDTYIDFSVGYAHHDNKSQRNCLLCLSSANATFGTEEYNILTGLGYTHSFGALSLRGYGQASSIYMDIGGYQETGLSTSSLLGVPTQHVLSITSTFGTELTYAWSVPFGVLIPRVSGEWVREYANNPRQFQASVGTGSTVISTGAVSSDWGNLSAGVQMVLPNGISSLINYRSMVAQGAVNHAIEGSLRLEF
jgi:uncharacterized protein YhjY with autotransporter beta-barrel domain